MDTFDLEKYIECLKLELSEFFVLCSNFNTVSLKSVNNVITFK